MSPISTLLRAIPPVDEMLSDEEVTSYEACLAREHIVKTIRAEQERLRQKLLKDEAGMRIDIANAMTEEDEEKGTAVKTYLKKCILKNLDAQLTESFNRVINCTGTVLHTNLGRAPLGEQVMERVYETGKRYNNLELNMETGKRGSRYVHVENLITQLTGAENAMVVNNNAAAVMLILNEMAQGQEVVISRGELVEIGGSFRIPEVMKQSGSYLVEVGTTNKTHLEDYRRAISDNTGMLMKVHTSNYQVVGFTDTVSREELVSLAHEAGLYVVEDLGSGLLLDLSAYGLDYEPTVGEVLSTGMDLVSFSGDKLLGGPQAGIIAGQNELVERLKRNQLTRALRIDKLTLKALEETLRLYLQPEQAIQSLPALNFLTTNDEQIEAQADHLLHLVNQVLPDGFTAKKQQHYSRVGGGAMPTMELPTYLVVLEGTNQDLTWMWEALRKQTPPVITRVQEGKLLMDARTVFPGEADTIVEHIDTIINKSGNGS